MKKTFALLFAVLLLCTESALACSQTAATDADKKWFAEFREAVLQDRRDWVADHVALPFPYGQTGQRRRADTREDFLRAYDDIFNARVRTALEKQETGGVMMKEHERLLNVGPHVLWIDTPAGEGRYRLVSADNSAEAGKRVPTVTPAMRKMSLEESWKKNAALKPDGDWTVARALGALPTAHSLTLEPPSAAAVEMTGKTVSVKGGGVTLPGGAACTAAAPKNIDLNDYNQSFVSWEDYGLKPLAAWPGYYAVTDIALTCPAGPRTLRIANAGAALLLSMGTEWEWVALTRQISR